MRYILLILCIIPAMAWAGEKQYVDKGYDWTDSSYYDEDDGKLHLVIPMFADVIFKYALSVGIIHMNVTTVGVYSGTSNTIPFKDASGSLLGFSITSLTDDISKRYTDPKTGAPMVEHKITARVSNDSTDILTMSYMFEYLDDKGVVVANAASLRQAIRPGEAADIEVLASVSAAINERIVTLQYFGGMTQVPAAK